MRSIISAILVISLLLSYSGVSSAESDKSGINRYLKPKEVTELDWILLTVSVESLSQINKWDNFGLITSVSIYRRNLEAPVGMTFTVDSNSYLGSDNDRLKKVFESVVTAVYRIIKISLPELDLSKDIYANFMLVGGSRKQIGEFKKGEIVFSK